MLFSLSVTPSANKIDLPRGNGNFSPWSYVVIDEVDALNSPRESSTLETYEYRVRQKRPQSQTSYLLGLYPRLRLKMSTNGLGGFVYILTLRQIGKW